ncbi:MAG: hypothetical protein ROW48_18335 [Bellilinea sp.]|jgi:hypothetical protein
MDDPEPRYASTLERLSRLRFGVPVGVIERRISVLTIRQQVLTNNPNRLQVVIQNVSGSDVRLAFEPRADLAEMLLIQNNGGMLEMRVDEDGEVTGYPLWGIAIGSSATVVVMEIVGL